MSTVSNNTDSAKTSPAGASLGDANGIYVSDKAKVKIAENTG